MKYAINAIEARILGVLIEKQLSTPEYYPLTLNALINACNQKSNRDPVMSLDEDVGELLLDVPHDLDEALGAVELVVATDLVELLPAVAHDAAGLADVAKFVGEI